jgi:hypothetical protein
MHSYVIMISSHGFYTVGDVIPVFDIVEDRYDRHKVAFVITKERNTIPREKFTWYWKENTEAA